VSGYDGTENEFRRHLIARIGARPGFRVWIQNNGMIPVKNERGQTVSYFDAGVPNGASDISGIVAPEGWRIEFELKGHRTKHSDAQKNWSKQMKKLGAVVAFYRIDKRRSLEENLDRAAYVLDEAIEVRRRGGLVSRDCPCDGCRIPRQVPA
jgi:hypothetical protein